MNIRSYIENLSVEVKVMIAIVVFLALASLAMCSSVSAQELKVPAVAQQYERQLTQAAQSVYGLDAPVARLAALIQVESSWDPQARSKYADGLAQFTPRTATWIAEIRPWLSPADPWATEWSLSASAEYTKIIYDQIKPFAGEIEECEHWAMTASGYNGGPENVDRDRKLTLANGADPDKWFGHTEHYSNRAPWAFKENRAYPVKILKVWEHRYIDAGWPGTCVCPVQA